MMLTEDCHSNLVAVGTSLTIFSARNNTSLHNLHNTKLTAVLNVKDRNLSKLAKVLLQKANRLELSTKKHLVAMFLTLAERKTLPEIGSSSPEISFNNVDFPMPFGPTTESQQNQYKLRFEQLAYIDIK